MGAGKQNTPTFLVSVMLNLNLCISLYINVSVQKLVCQKKPINTSRCGTIKEINGGRRAPRFRQCDFPGTFPVKKIVRDYSSLDKRVDASRAKNLSSSLWSSGSAPVKAVVIKATGSL